MKFTTTIDVWWNLYRAKETFLSLSESKIDMLVHYFNGEWNLLRKVQQYFWIFEKGTVSMK